MSTARKIKVITISDMQCPWCYVGKAHLDLAIEQVKQEAKSVEVDIEHQPFLVQDHWLDRFEVPEGGIGLLDLLTRKYGARAAASHFEEHHKRLEAAGNRAGISISTPWVESVVKSTDAHRLVEWCKEVAPDHVDAVMRGLFKAYFEEGKKLNDHDDLASVARAAGVEVAGGTAGAAKVMLGSNRFKSDVKEKARAWSERGVGGVPLFIIGDAAPTIISGAQPVEVIAAALRKHAGVVKPAGEAAAADAAAAAAMPTCA